MSISQALSRLLEAPATRQHVCEALLEAGTDASALLADLHAATRDDDLATRVAATRVIAEQEAPGAADILIERVLFDADWRVTHRAMAGLAQRGRDPALVAEVLHWRLLDGARDALGAEIKDAATALGTLGARCDLPEIVCWLHDGLSIKKPWSRLGAVMALARLGEMAALPRLLAVLEEAARPPAHHYREVCRALSILGALDADRLDALLLQVARGSSLSEETGQILAESPTIRPAVCARLVERLGHPMPLVRFNAALALLHCPVTPGAAAALVAAWEAESPYEWSRSALVRALQVQATGEEPGVLEFLRARLANPADATSRIAAASALARLQPTPETAAALLALSGELDSHSRRDILKLLGALPDPTGSIRDHLIAALLGDDDQLYEPAAEALGTRGGGEAVVIDALVAALEHEGWSPRVAAVNALGAIGPAAARALVPLARQAWSGHHMLTRGPVPRAIAAIAPGVTDLPALTGPRSEVAGLLTAVGILGAAGAAVVDEQVADAVAALLASPEAGSDVRFAAAKALGVIGSARHHPALLAAASSSSAFIQMGAASGLIGQLSPGTSHPLPPLHPTDPAACLAQLSDRKRDVRRAALLGLIPVADQHTDAIEALIKDRAASRRAAGLTLARFAGPAAAALVPRIAKLAKGRNKTLANLAALALHRIATPEATEALAVIASDDPGLRVVQSAAATG